MWMRLCYWMDSLLVENVFQLCYWCVSTWRRVLLCVGCAKGTTVWHGCIALHVRVGIHERCCLCLLRGEMEMRHVHTHTQPFTFTDYSTNRTTKLNENFSFECFVLLFVRLLLADSTHIYSPYTLGWIHHNICLDSAMQSKQIPSFLILFIPRKLSTQLFRSKSVDFVRRLQLHHYP